MIPTITIDPTSPGRPGRVLAGMSGGVDSSVAALILARQGWDVIGASLRTADDGADGLGDARAACRQLGLAWHEIDVRETFRATIIEAFAREYADGRTPNPCVFCNAHVKFRALLEAAARFGCDAVATGHYAEVVRVRDTGRLALRKATGEWKDQTYFMYRLSQDQLAKIIFPLAGKKKADVRQLAEEAGLRRADGLLVSETPDSQDICFAKDGDYAGYILQILQNKADKSVLNLFQPGPVINRSGHQIGTHQGVIHYTIGQRKGFSVKTTDRLFVVEKRAESNTLVVGTFNELLRDEITVMDVVCSGLPQIKDGVRLDARIRSSAREVPCRVDHLGQGQLRVIFDEPVASPATGQSCVFYKDGVIMAGGVIESSTRVV